MPQKSRQKSLDACSLTHLCELITEDASAKVIYLVGFACAGKSTVARLLADMLGIPCLDLDSVFYDRFQIDVADYIRDRGEQDFRQLEAVILQELDLHFKTKHGDQALAIVATGGGVILRQESRDILSSIDAYTIWLDTEPEEIYRRIQLSQHPSFCGKPKAELKAEMLKRSCLYAEVADLKIRSVILVD